MRPKLNPLLLDTALNLNPNQKKLKEHEEYVLKTSIIDESSKLKAVLSQSNAKLNNLNEDIGAKFYASNQVETNLKNHITSLNTKLYSQSSNSPEMYEKIDTLHNEILDMIAVIQERVRYQITVTRQQMELEVAEKFNEAEQKQKELMHQKMEEQKKVFDRMNYTKSQLEKIRTKFEETNTQCEALVKKNEVLRVKLQTTKKSNDALEEKLLGLQKEYYRVESCYNNLLLSNGNNNSNNKSNNDVSGILFYGGKNSNNNSTSNNNSNSKNMYQSTQITQGNKTRIIKSLQDNIKQVKNDYKKAYRDFIVCQKEKTDAQVLLQKCIEDVTIQLNNVNSKISSEAKNILTNIDYVKVKEGLERKLKILTYVYDNGLQNLKMKKTRLIIKSK